MIPTLRLLLVVVACLSWTAQAAGPLRPGQFRPYVEDGRTGMSSANEVLPLFDAMLARAEAAPSGLRSLDDAALLVLAADAAAANFYFPGSRAAAHTRVFEALARRKLATALETREYYATLVAARQWDDAAALARRFPDPGLDPLPARIEAGLESPGLDVWDWNPATQTLGRRSLAIKKGLALVVVSHPGCAFSRRAMQAIAADAALDAALPGRRYFVAPSFGGLGLTQLGEWNAAHAGFRHLLADRPMAWPFVAQWSTPQFFFLVDGQVVAQLEGWPGPSQAAALLDAARRAKQRADAASPPERIVR